MANTTFYIEKTTQLIEPILQNNNFELVKVEFVKENNEWYLRAYIDKEGGITIEDCVLVSRSLEKKLDELNFIQEGYILEISSPGFLGLSEEDQIVQ